MKKILFICSCNICRSPMAEFIFRSMLTEHHDIRIASAGISEEKLGQDMDEGAKACLAEHGIPFSERKAVLFQREDYVTYDMIICMDEWTKLSVQMKCFMDPERKIYKLLDFTDRIKAEMSDEERMLATELLDPYHSRDFEKAYESIALGCMGLRKHLRL